MSYDNPIGRYGRHPRLQFRDPNRPTQGSAPGPNQANHGAGATPEPDDTRGPALGAPATASEGRVYPARAGARPER